MSALSKLWLDDQVAALAAAMLADHPDPETEMLDRAGVATLVRATYVVESICGSGKTADVSDQTLALLAAIPRAYFAPDRELLPGAFAVANAMTEIERELELRRLQRERCSGILVSHAVYLLRQSHVTLRDWLTWLHRFGDSRTTGARAVLGATQVGSVREEMEGLLVETRDVSQSAASRAAIVDQLHDSIVRLIPAQNTSFWWTATCLAWRRSFFCWPLMAGASDAGTQGISLPFGLSLLDDDKSRVYFRINDAKDSPRGYGRYVLEGSWAHIEGSAMRWNAEWFRALNVGLTVAKRLWATQNGRFRFVEEEAAIRLLQSSAVVDVGPACSIVDAFFQSLDGGYSLTGRSAEAYWAQALLGLMLPGAQTPLGVVTGRIERMNGLDEIHHVEATDKKLAYANNAGFSRIVIPAPRDRRVTYAEHRFSTVVSDSFDEEVAPRHIDSMETPSEELDPSDLASASSPKNEAEQMVRAFLESIEAADTRKTIEVNFCHDVRTAADAMQVAGWRRTSFLRLPETQRSFTAHLRRLYLHELVDRRVQLTGKDLADHRRNPWTERDSSAVERLDRHLLSATRAIKFVERARLEARLRIDAEEDIGKWLAWKDHQIRERDPEGARGPGLGVLCLRTTPGDHEIRLWSMVAGALTASSEWWDRFQWSDQEGAAELLAQLFSNQRADPRIGCTPAPDVILLFDEANLTQRRTNNIFPDDFRGQWADLLNPSRETAHVQHLLNEALVRHGVGRVGGTKIIVLYGPKAETAMPVPEDLDAEQRDMLERVAVFRFDFSIQDAFVMMNYGRDQAGRRPWLQVHQVLTDLTAKGLLQRARGRLYVPSRFLPALRQAPHWSKPEAHLAAAMTMAPILAPTTFFIASNRDRSLEEVPLAEATWHLYRSRSLSPLRDRRHRHRCNTALANLTFLRPFADWDTVKQLQRGQPGEALELARELLAKERLVTGRMPHTSRIGALLNTIGHYGRSLSTSGPETRRAALIEEAIRACDEALGRLDSRSVSDVRRQKRKLFSEFVFCLKALGVPDGDQRLKAKSEYLATMIREIIQPEFFETLGYEHSQLDDFPVAQDWFRAQWDDERLTRRQRSTYAYAAARLHVGRRRDGQVTREPWDQPWIEYFALTAPADFFGRQLRAPLACWEDVYGNDENAALRFGQRVREWTSLGPKGRDRDLSRWALKLCHASEHLWTFVNNPDPERRLPSDSVEPALKFIRVVALVEAPMAFDFVQRTARDYLGLWPKYVSASPETEWSRLASSIVHSYAGWVALLAACGRRDDPETALVRSWLHAFHAQRAGPLVFDDPEELLVAPPGALNLADIYQDHLHRALDNGAALLSRSNERGWVVYGHLRSHLQSILRQLRQSRRQTVRQARRTAEGTWMTANVGRPTGPGEVVAGRSPKAIPNRAGPHNP